jgi:hypothetical protein
VDNFDTRMSQEKKFESEFLLSDEAIKEMGIDEFQTEIFRRKHYQVFEIIF